MRGLVVTSASYQVQDPSDDPSATFDPGVKYVLVAAYQKGGKTVLQPLVTEKDAGKIADLFQNKTLEVWLSNGKDEVGEFDVAIAKYRQVLQPLTRCQRVKSRVCLKNHFENLVSCEECPVSVDSGENADDEC